MKTKRRLPIRARHLIILVIIIAAVVVLVPQTGLLRQSITEIKHAELHWLILATIATVITYPFGALTYCLLAQKPIPYPKTLLMQFASMFANRLLPAGIGGLGANYAYLRKVKHTQNQAITVVTANNSLGIIAHVTLLTFLFFAFRRYADKLQLTGIHFGEFGWGTVAILAGFLVLGAVVFYYRKEILKRLKAITVLLAGYRKHPFKLSSAFVSSLSLTFCNVISLYFCVLAVGSSLSFVSVLIIFTVGVALGTAVPSPGGLGGVEAGLVGGLIAFDIPAPTAIAIALIYRLISYWLMLALGAIAFTIATKKHYF